MTLHEALERGALQLGAGPHPEKARRDAEVLLLHASGRSRTDLLAHGEDEFSLAESLRYKSLLDRRAKGEPIQYITGETEFYGLPFRVTPDVLIPRPETEHLVETVVALARSFAAPRIVDIGAGSGAISVALAHHLPKARITTTDLSEAALAIARENVRSNGVADRICFLQGDLLAPLAGEKFDIIVSNPPYVPARDRDSLSVEVREYEPLLALFAGEDGLDIYRRLIPAAFVALTSGGFIALEIGYGQADAVQNFLRAAGFAQIEFTPDLQSIPRVAAAQRP
ncbi:MAG TPA: peptide chain release factor N(5)-glutamine methyltransferase [Terracidiphilus sp.]|jgi:release factor glutamine methyltransferase|nr:peptide chain release factor N(5)-glutamine methyltransferase [Terracidiphilus sp.]